MRVRKPEYERTCFQEGGDFRPLIDSKADVAIIYGIDSTFEKRVEHWRQAGYRIHVMTGVAWGDYTDYVRGEWDGVQHYDDAQEGSGGFRIEHGISQGHDSFYMIPSRAYNRYLLEKLRRVVDAGALAIHMEEPEFWARAGYGPGFEREWADYYGEPWQAPNSSHDARYRTSKLMQHLYTRSLAFLFAEIKAYARQKDRPDFRCYVPTHSLINYTHWHIVSPEGNLMLIPECDGIIGQVWTGSARTPMVFRGLRRQRTFESGLCEYASCAGLVRGSGKKVWENGDPIEDNPHYSWDDYRVNWECTLAASMLVPENENWEIMPWPGRIFTGQYPIVNLDGLPALPLAESYMQHLRETGRQELAGQTRRALDLFMDYYRERSNEPTGETTGITNLTDTSSELRYGDIWNTVYGFYKKISDWEDQTAAQRIREALSEFYDHPYTERSSIPLDYAAELQVIFNVQADMAWPGEMEWLSGQAGVGVALASSMMFQRGEPDVSDEDMSSFYGLAMPLVKNGVALSMLHLERVNDPGYLDALRVIFLTYEGQKPPSARVHQSLVDWVKSGGVLALYGQGDVYDRVREWWNQDGLDYAHPQDHLTELAGLGRAPVEGLHPCGKGGFLLTHESPSALAHDPRGDEKVFGRLQQAGEAAGLSFKPTHILALRRGPYVIAAGMDESLDEAGCTLRGQWVNLFDSRLAVIVDPQILSDTRWLLYDLSRCPQEAWVIASAGRVEGETVAGRILRFHIGGLGNTECRLRARLPQPPLRVVANDAAAQYEWDAPSRTVLLAFPHQEGGTAVEINW